MLKGSARLQDAGHPIVLPASHCRALHLLVGTLFPKCDPSPLILLNPCLLLRAAPGKGPHSDYVRIVGKADALSGQKRQSDGEMKPHCLQCALWRDFQVLVCLSCLLSVLASSPCTLSELICLLLLLRTYSLHVARHGGPGTLTVSWPLGLGAQ